MLGERQKYGDGRGFLSSVVKMLIYHPYGTLQEQSTTCSGKAPELILATALTIRKIVIFKRGFFLLIFFIISL